MMRRRPSFSLPVQLLRRRTPPAVRMNLITTRILTTTGRSFQSFVVVLLVLLLSSSSTTTTTTTTTYAATTTATTTTTLDLFDQFDVNQDHMIDRTEYERAVPLFLSTWQQLLQKTTSSSTFQLSPPDSFSTWWMKHVFSYDTTTTTSSSSSGTTTTTDLPHTTTISIWSGFGKAFTSSVLMILATEIGDKTFFIAAILSMKHSRTLVFTGAFLALVVMTIISTGMGLILPKFLNRTYTHLLSGILFLYFGCKLLYDSRKMEHKVSEELEEVEEELLHQPTKKKKNKKKGDDDDDIETAAGHNKNNSTAVVSALASSYSILVTALTLTFVAEWGDRSQIATIALASAKNPVGVTLGAMVGHAICTAAACIGGRILASNISEKMVSQFGGVVFLLFGLHSLFFES